MWEKIEETVQFIQKIVNYTPDYGIILGSGLGGFANDIQVEHKLEYKDIPNFPISTVEGHEGALLFGSIGNKKVMAMQGRFHFYEGYDMKQVTFPVRVMKQLGINKLIVSNASGGVNPSFKVGDVMLITDHINMMPEHPLRGSNDTRFGPRFVNMSEPYSKDMNVKVRAIAHEKNIDLKEGVYLALQGPTFETLAEYKMVKAVGADCVGMSTVPEVIVAKHMSMDCIGVSIITDMGDEENIDEVNHEEVLEAAKKAEPIVRKLIKEFILTY
ncbi:purine-nucleoside phosphorylase [Flavobacterium sp.]|jgi:purine-nucleoside phosphorylase|uniref:purine-nucleoside phosphorylase n=1 Tax=Flavobacterium sp. TaxID=239 RepID=UPI002A81676F|nr:purine-nucleoside phosphorylase [Flavobacterium sp.]